MTPQQKRAIIVMIESIEHQLTAVRSLLVEAGNGVQVADGHRAHKPENQNPDYLTDAEDEQLGKYFGLTPAEKTEMLKEFQDRIDKAAKQDEKETPDVIISNPS